MVHGNASVLPCCLSRGSAEASSCTGEIARGQKWVPAGCILALCCRPVQAGCMPDPAMQGESRGERSLQDGLEHGLQ